MHVEKLRMGFLCGVVKGLPSEKTYAGYVRDFLATKKKEPVVSNNRLLSLA